MEQVQTKIPVNPTNPTNPYELKRREKFSDKYGQILLKHHMYGQMVEQKFLKSIANGDTILEIQQKNPFYRKMYYIIAEWFNIPHSDKTIHHYAYFTDKTIKEHSEDIPCRNPYCEDCSEYAENIFVKRITFDIGKASSINRGSWYEYQKSY